MPNQRRMFSIEIVEPRTLLSAAALPTLSIDDAADRIGEYIQFPIALSAPTAQDVTATYTPMPQGSSAPEFDTTPGTIRIPAGSTSGTIYVNTFESSYVPDQTFALTLSGLTDNAVFGNGLATESATGTVLIGPGYGYSEGNQTSISLDQARNPKLVYSGGPVSLSATVVGLYASTEFPSAEGSVAFVADGASVGIASLSQGKGYWSAATSAPLPIGTYQVEAIYLGSQDFAGSITSPISIEVGRASVTTLTFNSLIDATQTSGILKIGVAPAIAGAPGPVTGSVTIQEVSVDSDTTGFSLIQENSWATLGTYTLDANGEASVPVTASSSQMEYIATYNGDATFLASGSQSLSTPVMPHGPAGQTIGQYWKFPKTNIIGQPLNAKIDIQFLNLDHEKEKLEYEFDVFGSDSTTELDGTQILLGRDSFVATADPTGLVELSLPIRTLPAWLPSGSYHLVGEVVDSSDDYFMAPAFQSIMAEAPVRTLSASLVAVPARMRAGRAVFLMASTTNTGNLPAAGSLNIAINAATPDGAELIAVSYTFHASMKPGSTRRFRVKIKIPTGISPGAITLSGQAAVAGVTASFTADSSITI